MRAARIRRALASDAGSAPVEFVFVGVLLVALALAVVQLALALHIRNTVLDAAAEGARFGALADNEPQDGAARTVELIETAIGAGYATDVSVREERWMGSPTVVVTVRTTLPLPSDPTAPWRWRGMRHARRWTEPSDEGSASLEFLTVGLLLLVPLIYLVLVVSALQGAALAVEGAARQAARVFVRQANLPDAEAAAAQAIRLALADHGLSTDDAEVAITCEPVPADCLARRGFVTVEVALVVPLPLAPPVPGVDAPAGVTVDASATVQVSRFRADG